MGGRSKRLDAFAEAAVVHMKPPTPFAKMRNNRKKLPIVVTVDLRDYKDRNQPSFILCHDTKVVLK